MFFFDWLHKPWPWYVAGPLIGLIVPLLLLLGNKSFGVSSSLRHICAACFPAGISFFKYNWKNEIWNLLFVAGILLGGIISALWLNNSKPVDVDPGLMNSLQKHGITDNKRLMPPELFNWSNLFTLQGILLMVVGGFMVGFGTRYAGGCTSGHSIMGLSNLQWPSLIATICFMLGGFLSANLLIPIILKL
jgi:uncharacterized membrane protein YedE/YeeE